MGLVVVEIVAKRFVVLDGLRSHGHTERVFRLIVGEAAPGSGVLGENDNPGGLPRNHVEPVHALRKRLAIDGDGIAGLEESVVVGPGSPYLSVRLKAPEDLPAVDERPVIVNRDIGEADALREARVLAGAR